MINSFHLIIANKKSLPDSDLNQIRNRILQVYPVCKFSECELSGLQQSLVKLQQQHSSVCVLVANHNLNQSSLKSTISNLEKLTSKFVIYPQYTQHLAYCATKTDVLRRVVAVNSVRVSWLRGADKGFNQYMRMMQVELNEMGSLKEFIEGKQSRQNEIVVVAETEVEKNREVLEIIERGEKGRVVVYDAKGKGQNSYFQVVRKYEEIQKVVDGCVDEILNKAAKNRQSSSSTVSPSKKKILKSNLKPDSQNQPPANEPQYNYEWVVKRAPNGDFITSRRKLFTDKMSSINKMLSSADNRREISNAINPQPLSQLSQISNTAPASPSATPNRDPTPRPVNLQPQQSQSQSLNQQQQQPQNSYNDLSNVNFVWLKQASLRNAESMKSVNKIGGGGGGASRSPETKQTRVSLENMLVPEIKGEKKSGFATSGDEESSGLSEEEEVVRRKEKRNIVKTPQEPESQIHSNNNSSHISVQSNIKTTNPPKPSPPSPKPPPTQQPPTQQDPISITVTPPVYNKSSVLRKNAKYPTIQQDPTEYQVSTKHIRMGSTIPAQPVLTARKSGFSSSQTSFARNSMENSNFSEKMHDEGKQARGSKLKQKSPLRIQSKVVELQKTPLEMAPRQRSHAIPSKTPETKILRILPLPSTTVSPVPSPRQSFYQKAEIPFISQRVQKVLQPSTSEMQYSNSFSPQVSSILPSKIIKPINNTQSEYQHVKNLQPEKYSSLQPSRILQIKQNIQHKINNPRIIQQNQNQLITEKQPKYQVKNVNGIEIFSWRSNPSNKDSSSTLHSNSNSNKNPYPTTIPPSPSASPFAPLSLTPPPNSYIQTPQMKEFNNFTFNPPRKTQKVQTIYSPPNRQFEQYYANELKRQCRMTYQPKYSEYLSSPKQSPDLRRPASRSKIVDSEGNVKKSRVNRVSRPYSGDIVLCKPKKLAGKIIRQSPENSHLRSNSQLTKSKNQSQTIHLVFQTSNEYIALQSKYFEDFPAKIDYFNTSKQLSRLIHKKHKLPRHCLIFCIVDRFGLADLQSLANTSHLLCILITQQFDTKPITRANTRHLPQSSLKTTYQQITRYIRQSRLLFLQSPNALSPNPTQTKQPHHHQLTIYYKATTTNLSRLHNSLFRHYPGQFHWVRYRDVEDLMGRLQLEERGYNDRGLVIVEEVKKEEMRRILKSGKVEKVLGFGDEGTEERVRWVRNDREMFEEIREVMDGCGFRDDLY